VGPDAIVENIFMKLGAEWDGYTVTMDELVDGGEKIVALGNYSGKYKATGKSFSAPFAHVWMIKNGKAAKFLQFTDTVLVQRALS
jgi:ketosteroid isomerase-like protein